MSETMENFWKRAIDARMTLADEVEYVSPRIVRRCEFIVREANNRFKALTVEHQVTLSLMGW